MQRLQAGGGVAQPVKRLRNRRWPGAQPVGEGAVFGEFDEQGERGGRLEHFVRGEHVCAWGELHAVADFDFAAEAVVQEGDARGFGGVGELAHAQGGVAAGCAVGDAVGVAGGAGGEQGADEEAAVGEVRAGGKRHGDRVRAAC